MLPIKRAIVHHGGTKAKWYQLQLYWRRNNLKPYYHYLIDYNGQLIKGVQDFECGAHIANKNTGSIGICLLGDWSVEEPPECMIDTLDRLLLMLMMMYPSLKEIAPHNKYNDTICPGNYLTNYLYSWNYLLEKEGE